MEMDFYPGLLSRTIDTYIDIDAPPEKVWDVLLDFPRWAEWNPFVPNVEGVLEVGRKVHIKVVPPGRKPVRFNPEVWVVRPCEKILWGDSWLWIVYRGDHDFVLERLPQGGTRFSQRERYRGLPVLFMVMGGLFGPIKKGYRQMNEGLKQRVESMKSQNAK
jgi:hypothetical protein